MLCVCVIYKVNAAFGTVVLHSVNFNANGVSIPLDYNNLTVKLSQ